jgi:hypothetical protein
MGAQAAKTSRRRARQLNLATHAPLNSRAISDAARCLIDDLHVEISKWQQKSSGRKYKRRATATKFVGAVEAFLADLLRARAYGNGWVYRSLHAQGFTGQRVSYRHFVSLVEALSGLGLLEQMAGFQQKVDFGSGPLVSRGKASRFRAAPKLIALAKRHGITPAEIIDHFTEELPERPVILRAASTRSQYGIKERGRSLRFAYTPHVDSIEANVKELNVYLRQFEIGNALHQYYLRIFNEGDDPRFKWNLGGRLYSPGKTSYQQMPRDQRLEMTINGERVCEIDISASYLTIFLGLNDMQIDQRGGDPYSKEGLKQEDRDAVKQWFVATFGSGKFVEKWSKRAVTDFREMTGKNLRKFSPASIQKAALKAYPLLERWPEDNRTWADLMWIESEAIISTMLELKRERNVPSLAVHDSLLVPQSQRRLAEWKLHVCYERVTGVLPIVQMRGVPEGWPEPWDEQTE